MKPSIIRIIAAVLRKDILIGWPFVAGMVFLLAIATLLANASEPMANTCAVLARLVTTAMILVIVQQDCAVSDRLDALVRPTSRLVLLSAKLLFLLLFAVIPWTAAAVISDMIDGWRVNDAAFAGLPIALQLLMLTPIVMATAAATRTLLGAILLGVRLGAVCVLVLILPYLIPGYLRGDIAAGEAREAVSWLFVVPGALAFAILAGGALWLAYGRRTAGTARMLLLVGTAVLLGAAAATPTAALYTVQRTLLPGSPADPVRLAPVVGRFLIGPLPADGPIGDRTLRTDVICFGDREDLVAGMQPGWKNPLGVRTSVRVQGLAAGDRLIVDSIQGAWLDDKGAVIAPMASRIRLGAQFGDPAAAVLETAWLEPRADTLTWLNRARLRLDYDLTLLKPVASHAGWPSKGLLPGIGDCDAKGAGYEPTEWTVECEYRTAPIAELGAVAGSPEGRFGDAMGLRHSNVIYAPPWLLSGSRKGRVLLDSAPWATARPVLTAYRVASHFHRRLYVSPDLFKAPPTPCAAAR